MIDKKQKYIDFIYNMAVPNEKAHQYKRIGYIKSYNCIVLWAEVRKSLVGFSHTASIFKRARRGRNSPTG